MKKFSQFVAEYRAGTLDDILAKELQGLVKAVEHNLKAGEMKITLTLVPKADGELRAAIKYAVKEPRRDTVESLLFSTPEGDLLCYNPMQGDMFNKNNVKVIESESPSVQPAKSFAESE